MIRKIVYYLALSPFPQIFLIVFYSPSYVSYVMAEYEEEVRTLKDKTKCAHLRAKLKMCLLQTDCCKIERRTPKECLKTRHPSVPDECYMLRQSFFDCKHSIIDGRRRFRGPKG
ncbi:hypothetical protein QLX08_004428 [Tetragonisca angustula]|uniref:Cytochrome c oxidase assembly factor 5 n=1 Tax=Tetragonisca angustula TaxID=166442 RepID=A0AAW1A2I2_9HYME